MTCLLGIQSFSAAEAESEKSLSLSDEIQETLCDWERSEAMQGSSDVGRLPPCATDPRGVWAPPMEPKSHIPIMSTPRYAVHPPEIHRVIQDRVDHEISPGGSMALPAGGDESPPTSNEPLATRMALELSPAHEGGYVNVYSPRQMDGSLSAIRPAAPSAAHLAASLGDAPKLMQLREEGCDLGAPGRAGITPVHVACARGHAACLQVLVDAQVDLNAANKIGATPAHLACVMGHTECLAILNDAEGVEMHSRQPNGMRPIDLAALNGHGACVRILRPQ